MNVPVNWWKRRFMEKLNLSCLRNELQETSVINWQKKQKDLLGKKS